MELRKEERMVAQMIDRPTLVLNRNWQPVNVATVARALTMLWNPRYAAHELRIQSWSNWKFEA